MSDAEAEAYCLRMEAVTIMISHTSDPHDHLLAPTQESSGAQFENTLRPNTLKEYIGQNELKRNLLISLEAARLRNEPIEHILLHGPAGLGKTTLANILAHETESHLQMTSGPALEKQGDLAAILTNLKERDMLFIDEIHRLRPNIEEMLYSAMEDFSLDLMIGKGPSARSIRLNLPRFTLIGATTKVSMLGSPLRDRFGHVYKLEFYSEEEIQQILQRSAHILGYALDKDAERRLAKSSRSTPRICNRLLRRVRDFAEVKAHTSITRGVVEEALASLGVDELGLDSMDRALLKTIIEKFKGGPVGLSTIAAATSEETATVEEIYEPYLLKIGFLERTARGRIVTTRAYDHLRVPIFASSGSAR